MDARRTDAGDLDVCLPRIIPPLKASLVGVRRRAIAALHQNARDRKRRALLCRFFDKSPDNVKQHSWTETLESLSAELIRFCNGTDDFVRLEAKARIRHEVLACEAMAAYLTLIQSCPTSPGPRRLIA